MNLENKNPIPYLNPALNDDYLHPRCQNRSFLLPSHTTFERNSHPLRKHLPGRQPHNVKRKLYRTSDFVNNEVTRLLNDIVFKLLTVLITYIFLYVER